MENEQKKSDNHKRIYIIIATVLLCTVVYSFVCGRNNAGTDQLYKSTDAAVDTIEKEHADVGRELDAAKGQLDSAGAAVGRADRAYYSKPGTSCRKQSRPCRMPTYR